MAEQKSHYNYPVMSDYHKSSHRGAEFEGLDTAPFRPCVEAVSSGSPLVFITGPAGTGKSTLVRYLQHHFTAVVPQNERRSIAVVAPTGVAAMSAGGSTIHSFFRFPPTPADSHIPKIKPTDRFRHICRELNTLIVDEISMVRADMFEAMEVALRLNSGNNQPFGGIQIIMVGDLMQLPPIVSDEENRMFPPSPDARYSDKHFFGAPCIHRHKPEIVRLNEHFRFGNDGRFIEILHDIRSGRNLENALPQLNGECCRPTPDGWEGIALVPRNHQADEINLGKLDDIPGQKREHRAHIEGEPPRGRKPVPDPLIVKVGAQVMMVKNDSARRWVNGSLGKIIELDEESVRVLLNDGKRECLVGRETWSNYEYGYDEKTRRVAPREIGTYTQFPMTLGWAATIHKTQGATMSKLRVDMGEKGAFDFGQAYVALSRCRSMGGLYLTRPLCNEDIMTDKRALGWEKGEWAPPAPPSPVTGAPLLSAAGAGDSPARTRGSEAARHCPDGLPYCMGNAGDLLKHGVLAEFARWRCESLKTAKPFRFLDPFGGLPFREVDEDDLVVKRIDCLAKIAPECALIQAQKGMPSRYYGSGHVVRLAAEGKAEALVSDHCPDKREILRRETELMELKARAFDSRNGYSVLNSINNGFINADLVLIDPLGDFLLKWQDAVLPQIANAAKRTAIVLFALDMDTGKSSSGPGVKKIGAKWQTNRKKHLAGALSMSCPSLPFPDTSKYRADVVLTGPGVPGGEELQKRLSDFAEKLAAALNLSDEEAEMLKPRVIGREE